MVNETLPYPTLPPPEWRIDDHPVHYATALAQQEARAHAIATGAAPELVWLLEHPSVYTAGTSANPGDLHGAGVPIVVTGRGGQITWHGPGQRVAYVLLDLNGRGRDVRAFVSRLERWLVLTLADFGVTGRTHPDRVGVWVARPDKPPGPDGTMAEDKIAAIGVRLRRWVSFHGVALNVAPDLSAFAAIAPCGIRAPHLGVTSLEDLGIPVSLPEVDGVLRARFSEVFGGGGG